MQWLTLPEAAERVGRDVSALRRQVRDGQLLAVPHPPGGPVCLLAEELDEQGEPVKHLPAVITVLRDAGYSDDEALRWLITPDDSLPGTPLQALRENRSREVKRRAQASGGF